MGELYMYPGKRFSCLVFPHCYYCCTTFDLFPLTVLGLFALCTIYVYVWYKMRQGLHIHPLL